MEENSESSPESLTVADTLEYYTFSEANLHFDVIISSSHLKPRYNLIMPPKITKEVPQEKVPVVLNSHGKSWTMFYNGHLIAKTLDRGWKPFADDNELKIGDACFFELTEKSETRIVFKVVILRTASLPGGGDTEDEPIIIE